MTPQELMKKEIRAAASARLLLEAGDSEGTCRHTVFGQRVDDPLSTARWRSADYLPSLQVQITSRRSGKHGGYRQVQLAGSPPGREVSGAIGPRPKIGQKAL